MAIDTAESLARHGFGLVVLVSTHGGNHAVLDTAVSRLSARAGGAFVCAPRGDVGPEPGAHSGEWLTSVMLTLRPDLVELDNASTELAAELRNADAERGRGPPRRALRLQHRSRRPHGADLKSQPLALSASAEARVSPHKPKVRREGDARPGARGPERTGSA
jgi:creatinine amidohydrolase/Fe(II)-dependent formamide hydrolase-like protein